jgi:hypothetical protein
MAKFWNDSALTENLFPFNQSCLLKHLFSSNRASSYGLPEIQSEVGFEIRLFFHIFTLIGSKGPNRPTKIRFDLSLHSEWNNMSHKTRVYYLNSVIGQKILTGFSFPSLKLSKLTRVYFTKILTCNGCPKSTLNWFEFYRVRSNRIIHFLKCYQIWKSVHFWSYFFDMLFRLFER